MFIWLFWLFRHCAKLAKTKDKPLVLAWFLRVFEVPVSRRMKSVIRDTKSQWDVRKYVL